MAKPSIRAERTYYSLRIYINDSLHLELRMENHDGVQSWYEGDRYRNYFIEFYRKEGEPILLGYDDVDNWKEVLKLIDENL